MTSTAIKARPTEAGGKPAEGWFHLPILGCLFSHCLEEVRESQPPLEDVSEFLLVEFDGFGLGNQLDICLSIQCLPDAVGTHACIPVLKC